VRQTTTAIVGTKYNPSSTCGCLHPHGVSGLDNVSAPDNVTAERSVSAIILAGGSSSRLGQNKALIEIAGRPLIERVVQRLRPLVTDILVVTNTPDQLAFLGLPMTRDVYQAIGTLGGLHAGLSAIHTEYGLVVGCDMPFLNPGLLRYMISLLVQTCSQGAGAPRPYDVVMPRIAPAPEGAAPAGAYYEPLHAIYARRCLPVVEQSILSGRRRMLSFIPQVNVRYVDQETISRFDPQHLSFFNLNSADDLARMKALLEGDSHPCE
jgi:molybdopterin-guanine dinucleotide biosynthesis protein A